MLIALTVRCYVHIRVNFLFAEVNECDSSPCDGNSDCSDLIDGFVCDCQLGLYGDHCQYGDYNIFPIDTFRLHTEMWQTCLKNDARCKINLVFSAGCRRIVNSLSLYISHYINKT